MTNKSQGSSPRDDMGQLRKWAVIVLLILLVFVTVVNVLDDLFIGNKFIVDAAFYALIGGMVGGLFTSEAIAAARRNGNGNGNGNGGSGSSGASPGAQDGKKE